MAARLSMLLKNRLRHNDSVEVQPATVEVVKPGGNLSAVASKYGEVSLDLSSLPDGTYRMRVTHANNSTGPVGPSLAEVADPPARIYRPVELDVKVTKGLVTAATVTDAKNGEASLDAGGTLTVLLQPVWLKGSGFARGGAPLRLIVVHETSGPVIGPAINTALESGNGPHYEIDTDGQVVKFVRETDAAGHAGASQWDNLGVTVRGDTKSVNNASIGIEVVHKEGDFKEAQFVALLALLEAILAAHPDLPRRRIVGHSDVLTTDGGDRLGSGRETDPGPNFDWPRLEAQNLGMVPKAATTLAAGDYAGFFTLFPGASLLQNDDDAKSFFGNKTKDQRAKLAPKPTGGQSLDTLDRGAPVAELQADLRAIGYFLGNEQGTFGPATFQAVDRFQRHFFTKQRPHVGGPTGKVDRATAEMIKKVRP